MTNKKKRVVSDIANGNVSSEFDISRYMLSTDADVKVLTIPETGDEFQITIKPIDQLSNCANSPEFTPIAKVQSISKGNGKLEKRNEARPRNRAA